MCRGDRPLTRNEWFTSAMGASSRTAAPKASAIGPAARLAEVFHATSDAGVDLAEGRRGDGEDRI